MSRLGRYAEILRGRAGMAIALSAQYRWDFFVEGVLSLVWIAVGLLPLWVAFGDDTRVNGWSYAEVLLVAGWFTTLKGFFSAMFFPSLLELSARVRDGTLDFLLTKPADALFLLSTSRFELWKLTECVGGAGVMGWALVLMQRTPSLGEIAAALLLLVLSGLALYALCVLVGAAAFFAVRLEGLPVLFSSVLDFARWPVHIFSGIARLLFTFVIPIGVMTTYPALALTGRLDAATVGLALLVAGGLFVVARWSFSRAVGRYTSASS